MIDFIQYPQYALIIANGELPSRHIIEHAVNSAAYILAADGGANHLAELDIIPDTIIGDLDSIKKSTHDKFQNVDIINKKSQEENDLEKSIQFLLGKGFFNIIIMAIQGKREDHSFAAFQLIKKYKEKAKITLISDYSEIFIIGQGEHQIPTKKDQIISLFGFPRGYRISTKGLKYPLSKENLFESSRGISNVAIEKLITITMEKGNLLVFKNLKENG